MSIFRTAILVQKIGPYHHARFRAAAARWSAPLIVLEMRPRDPVYAWRPLEHHEYSHQQTQTAQELVRALNQVNPQAIVCVGYSDPEIHCAMRWAIARGVALVTCSDSTFVDGPRRVLKEALKHNLLKGFSAALCAGKRAHEYLQRLGLRSEQIFQPWDVVDNAYLAHEAGHHRRDTEKTRRSLGLPERYFLCVTRFIEQKNLLRLLQAYREYRDVMGHQSWDLVLCGGGPLEAQLRRSAEESGTGRWVHFPGFLQYSELPAFYGLAKALVLPSSSETWGLVVNEAMAAGLPVLVSSRCGCVPDLVRDGENGFIFDPYDVADIATSLIRCSRAPLVERAAMGQRSREIVAEYSPDSFAAGLESAVNHAVKSSGPVPFRSRAVVAALSRRYR